MHAVQKRLESNLKGRRTSRLSLFDRIRNLPRCESPAPVPLSKAQQKVEERRKQLEKWKEEKEKRKKELALQKKKPFVAGVPQKPLKFVPPPPPKAMPSTSGRVTRSQSAKNNALKQKVDSKPVESKPVKSFAPKNACFRPPEIKNLTKVPTLAPVAKSRKRNNKYTFNFESNKEKSNQVENKSPILKSRTQKICKETNVMTPKNPVPRSESTSEERLRSPKSNDIELTSVTLKEDDNNRISPCVTMSRGKANARKEMKQKIDEGLLDEDNSEAESVEHFRRQLASEVARLNELCDTWDKIREQIKLAESVQDEVLGAVGQARLLVSSKLQQFAGLLQRCARPEPGAPLVTPADLHGFWDMVFMQIENVDMRFKRLEQRRARNWADEPQHEPVKKTAKIVGKKVAKPTAGPSRLREMIAAARKAKKEQEGQQEQEQPAREQESEQEKTFEAGFFCVRSPVRSPMPATPNNKQNLLKAVLSSEAKKASASKSSSSFAMLRASILSRNLEAEGIAPLPQTPLPQININATPGRSILKPTNIPSVKSGKKSIKVVLFNDSDTDIQVTPIKDNIEHQNTDSGLSSMDNENKENKKIKPRLSRQDAVEDSGVVTRSRRKSKNTPQMEEKVEKNEKPRRSSRRKTLQENENFQEVVAVATPKRSLRRRKSNIQAVA